MAVTGTSTQLGCGRSIDLIWDHLDQEPDAHEATCPFCRAARTDLADLADATHRLRHDDSHDPHLQAGAEVVDRILTIARSEVRRGRRLPLLKPTADQTTSLTISEQAVTTVIRRVGDATGNVQIRRCTVRLNNDDTMTGSLSVSPSASIVDITLRVSVSVTTVIPQVLNDLRVAITTAVDHQVGITVRSIDAIVEDLFDA